MFWLQIVSNFIKILRAGQTPVQIAGGFALGTIAGLSPHLTLQILLVWVVILSLNVNLSSALLSFTLFGLIAYLIDPLFHYLGYYLLVDVSSLRGIWTSLYNAPIAPLTRFYNTVVLGSFVAAIVISPVVYFGMKRFVVSYRATVGARVERWKIYQIVSKSALVRWYEKIRDFGG
jgi:uncharacterized protein (TIGR03546 family)